MGQQLTDRYGCPPTPPSSAVDSYEATDNAYCSPVNNRDDGCTAVTAVVMGGRLMVANAGDSRAVLCRNGRGACARHFLITCMLGFCCRACTQSCAFTVTFVTQVCCTVAACSGCRHVALGPFLSLFKRVIAAICCVLCWLTD